MGFFSRLIRGKQDSISSLDVADHTLALAQEQGFPKPPGNLTIQSREGTLTPTGVMLVLT